MTKGLSLSASSYAFTFFTLHRDHSHPHWTFTAHSILLHIKLNVFLGHVNNPEIATPSHIVPIFLSYFHTQRELFPFPAEFLWTFNNIHEYIYMNIQLLLCYLNIFLCSYTTFISASSFLFRGETFSSAKEDVFTVKEHSLNYWIRKRS